MISTKNSAAGMRDAVKKLAPLAVKLAKGEKIGSSAEEGYIPNGVRVNFFEKERGSKRAVKMLIKKLNDKPYVTEYPMPNFDRVEPNPAVKDLAHAKIALVTSGGIVPKGNPDHIESSSASHYGEYDITGVTDLTEETYETAHGGYDPVYANVLHLVLLHSASWREHPVHAVSFAGDRGHRCCVPLCAWPCNANCAHGGHG